MFYAGSDKWMAFDNGDAYFVLVPPGHLPDFPEDSEYYSELQCLGPAENFGFITEGQIEIQMMGSNKWVCFGPGDAYHVSPGHLPRFSKGETVMMKFAAAHDTYTNSSVSHRKLQHCPAALQQCKQLQVQLRTLSDRELCFMKDKER